MLMNIFTDHYRTSADTEAHNHGKSCTHSKSRQESYYIFYNAAFFIGNLEQDLLKE